MVQVVEQAEDSWVMVRTMVQADSWAMVQVQEQPALLVLLAKSPWVQN